MITEEDDEIDRWYEDDEADEREKGKEDDKA